MIKTLAKGEAFAFGGGAAEVAPETSGDAPDAGSLDDSLHRSGVEPSIFLTETMAAGTVEALSVVRAAQRKWAGWSTGERLAVLRRARFALGAMASSLASAISPELARTSGDTNVAEILPLLAACKFLERNAEQILRVRRLGKRGLPIWLTGLDSEVRRVPFGTVLVIGPANYPLFLPGVQVLQALAAGNAVVWKPGRGGRPVAELFQKAMHEAGLPPEILRVTDESVEAGVEALQGAVDKIVFTGSAENGRAVMRVAAERLIPCVVEASGCDAVIVLPSADVERTVKALTFGMRLNGSATCMAPRRAFLVRGSGARATDLENLTDRLQEAFESVPAVTVPPAIRKSLLDLLAEAEASGAKVNGKLNSTGMRPILLTRARPEMKIARSDVFAPVLSVIEVAHLDEVIAADDVCPFGLTAAIFGDEREARALGTRLEVGTVLINDVIVSTADPRTPFGGRRGSGFGVTRGAEGLLEMTAAKVVLAQRGRGVRQYGATTPAHSAMFAGLIAASHSRAWGERWRGLKRMVRNGRNIGSA